MADISPKVHELKDEERKVKIKKRRNEEEYERLWERVRISVKHSSGQPALSININRSHEFTKKRYLKFRRITNSP